MAKKVQEEEKKEVNIFESGLVPKHEIVSGEEKADLLQKFNIHLKQLPRIKEADPAAKTLGARKGDVLRITRNSPVGADYRYYRVVV